MTQVQAQGSKITVQFTQNTVDQVLKDSKTKMMPLLRYLKKHGLKFKTAGCLGNIVQYFRTDNLVQILQKKKSQIDKDSVLPGLIGALRTELIYYKRPQNSQKLRFPPVLIQSSTASGKFASFKFDTNQSKKIYFIGVLLLILAGVLFPLWPYELKYCLWLISVTLLTVMVSIIIIRLILYTVLASFGISFWLLPNLLGDYGVLDSLKPFYSVSKWQNDIISIVLRVLCFSLFLYYCHSIYTEPEFYKQNFESAQDIVKDVHDWGVGKIKGQGANFSQRALTMDKILNETADAFEQKQDQSTTFQVPQEENIGSDSQSAEQSQQNQSNQPESKQDIENEQN